MIFWQIEGSMECGVMCMFDAVGFGALNLDKIYRVDKIPGRDEEGFVLDVEMHPGGSAANTIVGLSRLGLKTSFIGKTGDDEEGKILIDDFRNEGVDTSAIIRAKGRSGAAMIFVDEGGSRAILVDPGVNDTIKLEEVRTSILKNAGVLHLTSFICKNGLESFDSQKSVVKLAKELKFHVTFDPGLIYVEKGFKELEDIIKTTTVFLPNKSEIELLMNMDYRDGSREIISMGCKIVAVKLGREGCFITDGEKEYFIDAFDVKPVDTTGAGDAFNAGFIYGFLKGYPLKTCGMLGNFVASKNIQRVGARAGLPSKDEIEEIL
jgi:ribokinase